jgi:putative transcriptional regulator
MHKVEFLSNQLLIAMPSLRDPHFARGVAVMCKHDKDGAMGIVINRPSNLRLLDVLDQMQIPTALPMIANTTVFNGGPVTPGRGYVLHETWGDYQHSMQISDALQLTTSRDVLEDLAAGVGPKRHLVALGAAGWDAGQLEQELQENAWLHASIQEDILFQWPVDQRWQRATSRLGFDPLLMPDYVGHA